jgi:hypothetical protein
VIRNVKIILAIGLIFCARAALAQSPPEPKVMGWSKAANVGANFSFTSSQDVVGQTDGSSQTYGLNFKGSLNRNRERDEWRNGLSLLENTSKTPTVPRFVKSGDELKLESIYLYALEAHPDFGPYVKAEAAAPLFKGEDVRSVPQTYRVIHKDGTNDVFQGTSARLTDGLRPLTTKESVGAFWKAVQKEDMKVEARLGFGAMQVNANGQFAVKGANPAGETELNELSSVSQAGLEAALGIKAKLDERTSYEAGVETLTPFINDKAAGDTRDAFRLTNIDGFAKFSSHLNSWASLTYDYKLKIQPQLVDRAQQIHMVVLNVNYNLF